MNYSEQNLHKLINIDLMNRNFKINISTFVGLDFQCKL